MKVYQHGEYFGGTGFKIHPGLGTSPFHISLHSKTGWRVSKVDFGDSMALIPTDNLEDNNVIVSKFEQSQYFKITTKFNDHKKFPQDYYTIRVSTNKRKIHYSNIRNTKEGKNKRQAHKSKK